MRKKEKPLGKAREAGVPREELLLAEAIANSMAAGVDYARYTLGVAPDLRGVYTPIDSDGLCCCAVGALLIGRSGPDLGNISDDTDENEVIANALGTHVEVEMVYAGNDSYDEEWESREEGIGIGYRCFHTVHQEAVLQGTCD